MVQTDDLEKIAKLINASRAQLVIANKLNQASQDRRIQSFSFSRRVFANCHLRRMIKRIQLAEEVEQTSARRGFNPSLSKLLLDSFPADLVELVQRH